MATDEPRACGGVNSKSAGFPSSLCVSIYSFLITILVRVPAALVRSLLPRLFEQLSRRLSKARVLPSFLLLTRRMRCKEKERKRSVPSEFARSLAWPPLFQLCNMNWRPPSSGLSLGFISPVLEREKKRERPRRHLTLFSPDEGEKRR